MLFLLIPFLIAVMAALGFHHMLVPRLARGFSSTDQPAVTGRGHRGNAAAKPDTPDVASVDDCSICWEPMLEHDEPLFKIDQCKHTFHKKCLKTWAEMRGRCVKLEEWFLISYPINTHLNCIR